MRRSLPSPFSIAAIREALRRAPRLTPEEERDLFARTRRGDEGAKTRLVLGHLRFVVHVARRYRRHGFPLHDLVQEGVVGLLEAIRRFNPDRGVRLSTYAAWWIRAAIQDYVLRSRSIVRIATTPRHRAMFFNRAMADLDGMRDDAIHHIAERFGTSVEDIRAFAARASMTDRAIDEPAAEGLDICATLADPGPDPEARLFRKRERADLIARVRAAIPGLSRRERHILQRRFLGERKASLTAIGRELGLSKERVRQLEAGALAKIRNIAVPAPVSQ